MNVAVEVFVKREMGKYNLWTKSEACGEHPMGARFVMGGRHPDPLFSFSNKEDALSAATAWEDYLQKRREDAMANTRKNSYGKKQNGRSS
jgi:hypothetical protein